MNYFTNKYQQLKQFIMAKTATKAGKPASIKTPSKGFPENEKGWADFAKKNKVKLPFFCIQGIGYTRRTSDGKPYLSSEQFEADGGKMDKIHYFKIKK